MKLERTTDVQSPANFFNRSDRGYGLNLQKNASVLYSQKGMKHVAEVWQYFRRVQLIRGQLGERQDKMSHQAITYANELHKGGIIGLLQKAGSQSCLQNQIKELGLTRYSSEARDFLLYLCDWGVNRLIKSDDLFKQKQQKSKEMQTYLLKLKQPSRAVFLAVMNQDYQRAIQLISSKCAGIVGGAVLLNLLQRVIQARQYFSQGKPKVLQYPTIQSFSATKDTPQDLLACSSPEQNISSDAYFDVLIAILSRKHNQFKFALPKLLTPDISIFDLIAVIAKFFPSPELNSHFFQRLLSQPYIYNSLLPLIFNGFKEHRAKSVACLQRYLDVSSDLQTSCLISMYWFVFESDLKNKQDSEFLILKRIIDQYHELLNMHKKWAQRGSLDVTFSNLRQHLNPSQRHSYAREGLLARGNIQLSNFQDSAICQQCRSLLKAEALTQNPRLYGPQQDRVMSRCYKCKRNLVRCAVCMERLQIVNQVEPFTAKLDRKRETVVSPNLRGSQQQEKQPQPLISLLLAAQEFKIHRYGHGAHKTFNPNLPLDQWFVWCQYCRHGGHKKDISEWFEQNEECPVSNCHCNCILET